MGALRGVPYSTVETDAELNSKSKELIASIQRGNELLAMNQLERVKELALDKMRRASQKDIEAGIICSRDLIEELKAVGDIQRFLTTWCITSCSPSLDSICCRVITSRLSTILAERLTF